MEIQNLIKILEENKLVNSPTPRGTSWVDNFRVKIEIREGKQTLTLTDNRWDGAGTCEEITPLVSGKYGLVLINKLLWQSFICGTDYRTFQNLYIAFEPTRKIKKIASLECRCDQFGIHNGIYPISLEEKDNSCYAKIKYGIGRVELEGVYYDF